MEHHLISLIVCKWMFICICVCVYEGKLLTIFFLENKYKFIITHSNYKQMYINIFKILITLAANKYFFILLLLLSFHYIFSHLSHYFLSYSQIDVDKRLPQLCAKIINLMANIYIYKYKHIHANILTYKQIFYCISF